MPHRPVPPLIAGVYAIVATKTNERYVGSSADVYRALQSLFDEMAQGCSTWLLNRLYEQNGPSAFECFVIAEIENEEQRLDAEQWLLDSGEFNLNLDRNARHLSPRSRDLPPIIKPKLKPAKIDLEPFL